MDKIQNENIHISKIRTCDPARGRVPGRVAWQLDFLRNLKTAKNLVQRGRGPTLHALIKFKSQSVELNPAQIVKSPLLALSWNIISYEEEKSLQIMHGL